MIGDRWRRCCFLFGSRLCVEDWIACVLSINIYISLDCEWTLSTVVFTLVILSNCSFLLCIFILLSYCFCPCFTFSLFCSFWRTLCWHFPLYWAPFPLFSLFTAHCFLPLNSRGTATYTKAHGWKRRQKAKSVVKCTRKRCIGHNGFCFVFLKNTNEKTKKR